MPFVRCVYSGDKEMKQDITVAISSAVAAALEKVFFFPDLPDILLA